jgi:hypothetical protein
MALTAMDIRGFVERVLRQTGRRVDVSSPFVDASLPDGSRLHVVIPDITKDHWSVNIRKFSQSLRGLGDLVEVGVLNHEAASYLRDAVASGQSASTHAARVFVHQATLADATAIADRAALVALGNHGFDSYSRLERFCEPASCLSPGAAVTIRVSVEAPLFSIDVLPGILGAETVTVAAESTRVVSRYGVPR